MCYVSGQNQLKGVYLVGSYPRILLERSTSNMNKINITQSNTQQFQLISTIGFINRGSLSIGALCTKQQIVHDRRFATAMHSFHNFIHNGTLANIDDKKLCFYSTIKTCRYQKLAKQ